MPLRLPASVISFHVIIYPPSIPPGPSSPLPLPPSASMHKQMAGTHPNLDTPARDKKMGAAWRVSEGEQVTGGEGGGRMGTYSCCCITEKESVDMITSFWF